MRCYTTDGHGISNLREVERPAPGPLQPNDVRIDVQAVALNYRDLLVASGDYGGPQDPSIIACSDMSGTVVEMGSEVTEFQPGDRVANAPFRNWPAGTLRPEWAKTFVGGQGVDGVLAEQIVYPAQSLVRLPGHCSFHEGATLTVAGLTAWAAVVTHGRVQAGDWVLVQGTGGVSLFAAQIAKMSGARVLLTSSNTAKAARALAELGVDATLDYRNHDWSSQVRSITDGAGVDVVVEVAGGASLAQSVAACAYGARISVIGILGGLESSMNLFPLIMRQVSMRGIYMESAAEMRRFVQAVDAGRLQPVIDQVFGWDEAPAAYAALQSQKHFGKIVIDVTT